MQTESFPSPREIRQAGPTELGISWSDGHESVYPVRDLRLSCKCAECVDELTGVKRISPESIPGDIRPMELKGVGNYGIQISWSDGHGSGIFSYLHLREICPCPKCAGPRP